MQFGNQHSEEGLGLLGLGVGDDVLKAVGNGEVTDCRRVCGVVGGGLGELGFRDAEVGEAALEPPEPFVAAFE